MTLWAGTPSSETGDVVGVHCEDAGGAYDVVGGHSVVGDR